MTQTLITEAQTERRERSNSMEKVVLPLLKMMVSIGFVGFVSIFIRMLVLLILKPRRIRSVLEKQGIKGPPSSFLLGNIRDMKKVMSKVSKAPQDQEQAIIHNCSSKLFPIFEQWTKEYGSIFMFSLGNMQILHANHPDIVKDINTCTSLDFGKPSYQQKRLGPLLGQGILTSNGALWAHQRKVLAPELYLDKVKGMMSLMVESSMTLVNALSEKVGSEGGVADIKIDDYLTNFSRAVMSRACFGSNYASGDEIFQKIRALQVLLASRTSPIEIPGMRYLPTKTNREAWKLERELRALILNVVKDRKEARQEDLLQIILNSAQDSDSDQDSTKQFIVDNCKNIFLAGYETTAVASTWALMLLASNLEWQAKVRAEILEVCQGRLPDADMIRKMKMLNMVIHETLRLYPPGILVSREALQDMKLGDIHLPKGVMVWSLMVTLHQDPEIWGEDAHKFNPERFANGVSGACKNPQVYIPFGVGPRMCLGQSFAMAELKIVLSIIVSSFSFSLSPKYRHSPARRLVIVPEYGVDLLITKL